MTTEYRCDDPDCWCNFLVEVARCWACRHPVHEPDHCILCQLPCIHGEKEGTK